MKFNTIFLIFLITIFLQSELLITGATDSIVRIWNLQTGELQIRYQLNGTIRRVAASNCAEYTISNSNEFSFKMDNKHFIQGQSFNDNTLEQIHSISLDGKTLIRTNQFGNLELVDNSFGKKHNVHLTFNNKAGDILRIIDVNWEFKFMVVAQSAEPDYIMIYSLYDGSIIGKIVNKDFYKNEDDHIQEIKFIESKKKEINDKNDLVNQLSNQINSQNQISAISNPGLLWAYGLSNGKIRIQWMWQFEREILHHSGAGITSIAMDWKHLVSANNKGIIVINNLNNNQFYEIDINNYFKDDDVKIITNMQLSMDGTNIVVSLYSGDLLHFDIINKNLIKRFNFSQKNNSSKLFDDLILQNDFISQMQIVNCADNMKWYNNLKNKQGQKNNSVLDIKIYVKQ